MVMTSTSTSVEANSQTYTCGQTWWLYRQESSFKGRHRQFCGRYKTLFYILNGIFVRIKVPFKDDKSMEKCPQTNMRKCQRSDSASYFSFVFFCQPTPGPLHRFTLNTSNIFSRKDVPLVSRKQNFVFRLHFPQNGTCGPIFKFRLKKALTVGMLTCKLPLIDPTPFELIVRLVINMPANMKCLLSSVPQMTRPTIPKVVHFTPSRSPLT